MATTPPVPDNTKFQNIIAIIDNAQTYSRDLVDAIKKPNGKAVARYKDLHALALQFKDAVNGLYAMASASDKSLQTGKRKAEKNEPRKPKEVAATKADAEQDQKPKAEKKQTRAERKEMNRAKSRSSRANAEPEMTGPTSDEV